MKSNHRTQPEDSRTKDQLQQHSTQNKAEAAHTLLDTLPKKKLTGPEMIRVLKICGKRIADFAMFLNRSDNYVRQSLGYLPRPIPLTYYDALKAFVGEENFLCSLREMGGKAVNVASNFMSK